MPAAYSFPQVAPGISRESGEKGIAKLYHPDVGTLRLRTAPTEFSWKYTLKKRIDNTYGGRVVQLLGTTIDEFQFKADSGNGRWPYANKISKYMRDVMIAQRNGDPASFEYTTRGWKMMLYIVSVPFQDAIEEVKREFVIQCKVQEDVSQIMSKNTLDAELRRLQAGINFKRGKYNDPRASPKDFDSEAGLTNILDPIGQAASILDSFAPSDYANFLPNGLQGGGFNLGNLIGG